MFGCEPYKDKWTCAKTIWSVFSWCTLESQGAKTSTWRTDPNVQICRLISVFAVLVWHKWPFSHDPAQHSLGKFRRQQIETVFSYFSQNIGFDIMSIVLGYQILFSEEKKQQTKKQKKCFQRSSAVIFTNHIGSSTQNIWAQLFKANDVVS